jgi:hypothetical protein
MTETHLIHQFHQLLPNCHIKLIIVGKTQFQPPAAFRKQKVLLPRFQIIIKKPFDNRLLLAFQITSMMAFRIRPTDSRRWPSAGVGSMFLH